MTTGRFHPWRRMRDLGPAWKLKWAEWLPSDILGLTDYGSRSIYLRTGMTFEERRCTITHEVEHVLRGPVASPGHMTEELVVDRISSRRLMPSIREVCDSLAFHRGDYEAAAADLWVDPQMLEVRLSSLRSLERGYYESRLADIELDI